MGKASKRRPPIPGLRQFRALKRQYPHLEDQELWRLAGHNPQGAHPLWAQHGQALRPVIYRGLGRRRGKPS